MIPGAVQIHLVPFNGASGTSDHPDLTTSERIRATAFHFREDAQRWAFFRSSLRAILGSALGIPAADVPIILTACGKPELAEPYSHLHFNVSHCDDLALVALCTDGPVGIDIEPLSRACSLLDCESTFCHPADLIALPTDATHRSRKLLELWTAKEALLKALGTGFTYPPECVNLRFGQRFFQVESDTPLKGATDQRVQPLHHPALAAYCCTLSSPASAPRTEIIGSAESTRT